MKLILAALMLVALSATASDNPLADAVREVVATVEPRMLPSDWQCFQPGVVQWVTATMQWQKARIEELERQLEERK